jgi:hypothetical protein
MHAWRSLMVAWWRLDGRRDAISEPLSLHGQTLQLHVRSRAGAETPVCRRPKPTDRCRESCGLQFLRCGLGHVHAERIYADPQRCSSQEPQRDEWAPFEIRSRDSRFDFANDDCQSSVCARSRAPNRIGPGGVARDSGGALQEPSSKIVPNTQPLHPCFLLIAAMNSPSGNASVCPHSSRRARPRQDALYVEFFELARVTFVGSVAERREMPSDCRCERSAKWSYLSRAKRVRLSTTTKCTPPLFSRQYVSSSEVGCDPGTWRSRLPRESIRGSRDPGGDSIPRRHVRMSAEAPAESGGWLGPYW